MIRLYRNAGVSSNFAQRISALCLAKRLTTSSPEWRARYAKYEGKAFRMKAYCQGDANLTCARHSLAIWRSSGELPYSASSELRELRNLFYTLAHFTHRPVCAARSFLIIGIQYETDD